MAGTAEVEEPASGGRSPCEVLKGRVSRGIMHVFAGEETRAARSNAILQAANKAFKKKVGAVNRNAQL